MSGGRYNIRRTRRVWRVEGEKKRSRRMSSGCWRIRNGHPADGKDREGVGKRPLDKGGKGGGTGAFGRGSEGGEYHGKELGYLGGENTRSKGFWGRWQANGCFRRCRGEGFCAWNVRGTGPTGCNRAQGSFFADVEARRRVEVSQGNTVATP